jgi:hypothetical protein
MWFVIARTSLSLGARCGSRTLVLWVVLLALLAGGSAAASVRGVPPAVPVEYQRLYALLESQLAAIHPGPVPRRAGMLVGAELQLANGNRGAALLKPDALGQVRLELAELQRLGVDAVTVSVTYPILDPAFPQQRRYLEFYKRVARMVHRRGMTLAVDTDDALSGTPFSTVRWSYPDSTVASYAADKGRMARLVIAAMHPRYLTLEGQPDTETILTGVLLANPVSYARAVSTEVKEIGPHPGTLLGAGPGSWSPPSYDHELARIGGLDYLDTQVLPTDPQAIANIGIAARIARGAGKEVVMDSAWLWVPRDIVDPGGERLRPVEGEHLSACGLGIERVREARLGPRRLVDERQRALECRGNVVGEPVDVLCGLPGDAGQRVTLLLCLERADCPAVHEKKVVGSAVPGRQHKFPDGDAASRAQVDCSVALNGPTGRLQHLVDADTGLRLGREIGEGAVGHDCLGLAGRGMTSFSPLIHIGSRQARRMSGDVSAHRRRLPRSLCGRLGENYSYGGRPPLASSLAGRNLVLVEPAGDLGEGAPCAVFAADTGDEIRRELRSPSGAR